MVCGLIHESANDHAHHAPWFAQALGTATVFAPALLRHAGAQTPPLPPLPNISANDASLLQPGQPGYDTYEPAANERMLLRPKLRALCKTANAVSAMVSWCHSNNLPFALRSGGHSFAERECRDRHPYDESNHL